MLGPIFSSIYVSISVSFFPFSISVPHLFHFCLSFVLSFLAFHIHMCQIYHMWIWYILHMCEIYTCATFTTWPYVTICVRVGVFVFWVFFLCSFFGNVVFVLPCSLCSSLSIFLCRDIVLSRTHYLLRRLCSLGISLSFCL